MPVTRKFILQENEMPTSWYNIMADMPNPPHAVLHPGTKQPVTPADFEPLFPKAVVAQEMSTDRWIEIPEEVQHHLRLYRPTTLHRAIELEKALDTPAHIYYKWEGTSPAGSHKVNTAFAQAYYNKQEGTKRITTETGAGQWGSSLSLAGSLFGIDVKVYMVKISYDQKPYRRLLMESWGGKVVASPSNETAAGRAVLAKDPNSNGSLGIAISEAVEEAVSREDTKYALGSVLNHVCIHQSIIGLETKKQLEMAGEEADVIIGCHGGGSNYAGLAFPFIGDNITLGKKTRCVAVEPISCPSLTKGSFAYDFGDTAGMTPLTKMYTLGHDFMPPGIHAGGLRYHGASALVSQLLHEGRMEAKAVPQNSSFAAAVQFARTEGFLPAPESSHAIRGAIDEALEAKKEGKKRVIVFNLSGHGHFDLTSYEKYFQGKLVDQEFSTADLKASLSTLPIV
ncbi:MAG: TrpB-like pyridoxal-phosphate dependent enzyme [Spirochaetes bacterium GWB1_48_6]|nr:MAG: TrpB-like pyridoxal-phosphate dependent enzyme [Spirochaetes bacterium GWB1_48_6]